LRWSAILAKIHAAAGHGRADAVTPGIYSCCTGPHPFGVINAYPVNGRSKGVPVCSIDGVYDPYDIAVDRQGDLLVPDSFDRTITVYAGPGLCGPKLGTIADPYGEPSDVASRNAANGGKIVVANVKKVGSVSVCTLSGGCTAELRAGGVDFFAVALAPNGDCWATGYPRHQPSASLVLVYFAHCRGRGVIATGFQIPGDKGLDIDDNGNLVILSYASSTSQLYIYSGCNPACTLVGGPFQLGCCISYFHLDASSKMLVGAGAGSTPELKVYSYSTSGIKYEYSISNGLGSFVVSAAFSPASKE
jgi:hypothetical protein